MVGLALFGAVVTLMVGCACGYPTGAANDFSNLMGSFSSYCTSGNFRPNHTHHLPQSSYAPYTIKVNAPGGTIYRPGQVVTVTIEGRDLRTMFRGFFIQGDSTKASFAGDITCDQGHPVTFCSKPGATHVDALDKNKVVCKWTPPDFQLGTIQFVASIVQNFSTFWTGVKGDISLRADSTTMTFEQKSKLMMEQMMRQMQSGGGIMSMLQKQGGGGGNPLAGMLGGSPPGGQATNRFSSMMSQNRRSNNPRPGSLGPFQQLTQ